MKNSFLDVKTLSNNYKNCSRGELHLDPHFVHGLGLGLTLILLDK